MRRIRNIVCFFKLISLCQAAVTLYTVEKPTDTDGFTTLTRAETRIGPSAIGVNNEGATTYVEGVINSLLVLDSPFGTITLNSVPETRSYTWVEDSNGYSMSMSETEVSPYAGRSEVCTFGDDGMGACVQEFVLTDAFTTSTTTSSYSGPVRPWVTIGVSDTDGMPPTETAPADDNATVRLDSKRSGSVGALIVVVGAGLWLGL